MPILHKPRAPTVARRQTVIPFAKSENLKRQWVGRNSSPPFVLATVLLAIAWNYDEIWDTLVVPKAFAMDETEVSTRVTRVLFIILTDMHSGRRCTRPWVRRLWRFLVETQCKSMEHLILVPSRCPSKSSRHESQDKPYTEQDPRLKVRAYGAVCSHVTTGATPFPADPSRPSSPIAFAHFGEETHEALGGRQV